MNTCSENLRYSCSLAGAIPSISSICGAVPIIHAGPGCGLQLFMGQHYGCGFQNAANIGGTSVPCSNTYEQEIVFGGEKRLSEVIKTSLEIMEGDFSVVITGCTSAIIGDDINAVVKEFNTSNHPVVYAETSGFKGNTYTGYEAVWEAMIKQLVTPLPRNSRTVNLFGIIPTQDVFWCGNIIEIEKILAGLGLIVNTFYTNRQGLQAVKNSASAALNIFFSPYLGSNIQQLFETKFNIPSIRFAGAPIGPTATTEFINAISALLELDAHTTSEYIKLEEQNAYDFLDKASLVYTGLNLQHNFAVIGDTATVIPMLKFLTNDFGQIPVAAIITDNPPKKFRKNIINEINSVEYTGGIATEFIEDNYLIKEALKKYDVSYMLGSSMDKEYADNAGIHCLSISFPVTDRLILNKAYAGYNGAVNLVEDYVNSILAKFAVEK